MKLVAYFSATNETRKVALELAKHLSADLFEIEPAQKYSMADLDWRNESSRSSIEMKNKQTSRPTIISKQLNLEKYDVIYLGFPIWWYTAPVIINTFLENYKINNKKIVLFATSGSSDFGNDTKKDLLFSAPTCEIIEGKVNPKDFEWAKY